MPIDPLDKLRAKKRAAPPDFSRAKLKAAEIAANIPEDQRSGSAYQVSKHLAHVAECTDEALRAVAGERVDFTLITWTAGRVQYISTATRATVLEALKEMVVILESGQPTPPSHLIQG